MKNATSTRSAKMAASLRSLPPSALRAAVNELLIRAEIADRAGAKADAKTWREAARLAR